MKNNGQRAKAPKITAEQIAVARRQVKGAELRVRAELDGLVGWLSEQGYVPSPYGASVSVRGVGWGKR